MSNPHTALVNSIYSQRATGYNEAQGGWHIKLGQDFVEWVKPQAGETVLDLACGTGLVTIPMAQAVGREGRVVAIDLTAEMIEVGKASERAFRDQDNSFASIDWHMADITSEELLQFDSVKTVLTEGGFDIISVCSAMVLLPDQAAAMKLWVERLLKKGGRLIVDVPTEDLSLQLLLTYHLPAALGLSTDAAKGRVWVRGKQSLENMCKSNRLEVVNSIRTNSYIEEVLYDGSVETALRVLEEQKAIYGQIVQAGKLEEARKLWPQIWTSAAKVNVDKLGKADVRETIVLYVCVGRKI